MYPGGVRTQHTGEDSSQNQHPAPRIVLLHLVSVSCLSQGDGTESSAGAKEVPRVSKQEREVCVLSLL